MEKKSITDEIFYICKIISNFNSPYTWGEVKDLLFKNNVELQDNDTLIVGFEDGWDEKDSARDPVYSIRVNRNRLETDDEFEKRKRTQEKLEETNKNNRYKSYLKLKEEFDATGGIVK